MTLEYLGLIWQKKKKLTIFIIQSWSWNWSKFKRSSIHCFEPQRRLELSYELNWNATYSSPSVHTFVTTLHIYIWWWHTTPSHHEGRTQRRPTTVVKCTYLADIEATHRTVWLSTWTGRQSGAELNTGCWSNRDVPE